MKKRKDQRPIAVMLRVRPGLSVMYADPETRKVIIVHRANLLDALSVLAKKKAKIKEV